MSISSIPDPALSEVSPAKSRQRTFLTRFLFVVIVVAIFGQPNALFVDFPPYSILAFVILLLFFGAVFYSKLRSRPVTLPMTNLVLPTTLFFLYSLVSLFYAPDPSYGARILFSSLFKFLLFAAVIAACAEEDLKLTLSGILSIVVVMGGLFSVQGLLYVIGFLVFHLPPGDYVGLIPGYGGPNGYDPGLDSLGVLGFAKATNEIGGLRIPRCQAMFLEPSSMAEFFELSLFATLGWLALSGYVHKKRAYWLVGLQLGALLFSFSTAGWFAIAAGMLVYGVVRLVERRGVISRRKLTRLVRPFAIALAALLLFCIGFPALALDVYKAVFTTKLAVDATDVSSASDRLSKASDSLSLVLQRPLFGWGSNQVPIVAANHQSVGNALLTVATELGGIGLVIYLFMLGAISWTIADSIRRAYRTGSETMIGLTAALTGSIAASFIHSMFVDNEWVFSYWISLTLLYLNRRLLLRMSSGGAPNPSALLSSAEQQ